MQQVRYAFAAMCAGFALAAAPAAAATWHVDAARPDDSGDGASWATAKRTIQAAVLAAAAGDAILVTNGVYGPIATANKAIAITSVEGPEETIIDGSDMVRCATLGEELDTRSTMLGGFTLRNGKALEGAGAFGGTLTHCVLMSNSADEAGGGTFASTLTDCALVDNKAPGGGGAAYSALRNCTLVGNAATYGGGAGYGALVNCVLKGNTASYGGGFYGDSPNGGTMANCVVSGNVALQRGGGAYGGTLRNCTVVGNSAVNGGGVYGGGILGGAAYNSIVAGNLASVSSNNCHVFVLRYSCSDPVQTGAGNIPIPALLFADAPNDDWRLVAGSACIDAGSNAQAPAGVDLDGFPRIVNGVVDMGAYEHLANIVATFNPGAGNAPEPPTKLVTYLQPYGALPEATRVGYTFGGWWTGVDGTGSSVTSNTVVTNVDPHDVHARWTANAYTVLFDPQGGATPVPTNRIVVYDAPYGPLATSTRAGFVHVGWRTAPEGGESIAPDSVVAFTGVQTLYAHWMPNAFMVTDDSFATAAGVTNAVSVDAAEDAGDGDGALRLGGPGALDDGEMAGIEWTATGPGRLSFAWKTSSEDDWDWLSFYEVGSGPTNRISGTATNWVPVTVDILGAPGAVHVFRWEYEKDPIGDAVGLDSGWVDALLWEPLYAVSVESGMGDGNYAAGEVAVLQADPAPAGQRFWRWTGATNGVADVFAPATTLVVSTNDVAVSATYIPVVLRMLEVVNGSGSGEHWECSAVEVTADPDPPYKIFDRWSGDAEAGLFNPLMRATSLTMPTRDTWIAATYRDALDRVAGAYGREFAVDGVATGVTASVAAGSPSGTPALQLGGPGIVPDGGFTAIETQVDGSGEASFVWTVSSQSGGDFLRFLVDDVAVAAISGTKQPWTAVTNRVEGSGTHVLRWEYVKNGSLASSADAGWVDDIVWAGDTPAPAFAPSIVDLSAGEDVFGITFLGERGIPYRVDAKTNLSDAAWAPLAGAPTETGETNGVFRFRVDVALPPDQPAAFYRVVP